MNNSSPQVELFPETIAESSAPVKKGRGKGRKLKAKPEQTLSRPSTSPLVARPLLGRKGAILLVTVVILMLVALVDGINLLWHQGVILTAIMLVALVIVLGGLSGYRLWREWRAVIALNAVLERCAVVNAVLNGAPLADRHAFCLHLIPITRDDDRHIEAAEQWLEQWRTADNDAALLRAFINDCVAPVEAVLIDELFANGPTAFLSGSSWLVQLANIKRSLQLTDALLRAYQIDSGWFVRWRLLDAASSYLASSDHNPKLDLPNLRWLAMTLLGMLAAQLGQQSAEGEA